MVERVFNDELNAFVYRVEKKNLTIGLNKENANIAWQTVTDGLTISLDFEDYKSAREFTEKFIRSYSIHSLSVH